MCEKFLMFGFKDNVTLDWSESPKRIEGRDAGIGSFLHPSSHIPVFVRLFHLFIGGIAQVAIAGDFIPIVSQMLAEPV
jgi:hypothetical protein